MPGCRRPAGRTARRRPPRPRCPPAGLPADRATRRPGYPPTGLPAARAARRPHCPPPATAPGLPAGPDRPPGRTARRAGPPAGPDCPLAAAPRTGDATRTGRISLRRPVLVASSCSGDSIAHTCPPPDTAPGLPPGRAARWPCYPLAGLPPAGPDCPPGRTARRAGLPAGPDRPPGRTVRSPLRREQGMPREQAGTRSNALFSWHFPVLVPAARAPVRRRPPRPPARRLRYPPTGLPAGRCAENRGCHENRPELAQTPCFRGVPLFW